MKNLNTQQLTHNNDGDVSKSKISQKVKPFVIKDIELTQSNGNSNISSEITNRTLLSINKSNGGQSNNLLQEEGSNANGSALNTEKGKKMKKNYSLGVIDEVKEKTIEDNTIIYTDGSKYMGTMKFNERSGKGIYFNDKGTIYDGEWFNNVFHGQGTLYLDDGMIYNGTFVNGCREGKGSLFSQDHSFYYTGEWREDEKCGVGKRTLIKVRRSMLMEVYILVSSRMGRRMEEDNLYCRMEPYMKETLWTII